MARFGAKKNKGYGAHSFMEIAIPLPDMAAQNHIASLWRLQNREIHLRQQLLEETKRMHRLAGQRIFDKFTSKPEKT